MAEALYVLTVNTGLIAANDPCGSYIQPYSCLMINPSYQLVFLISGGFIGFLFYFVNVMHKNKFAFRMEVTLAFESFSLGVLWLILPRYDSYFAETAYFAEIFIGSAVVALAAFLTVDHVRSKGFLFRGRLPTPTLQNPS